MKWRGGKIEAPLGEVDDSLKILGGGSTTRTKYVQHSRMGEEFVKEQIHSSSHLAIPNWGFAITPTKELFRLGVDKGVYGYSALEGNMIYPLRMQLKISVKWQNYVYSTAGQVAKQEYRTLTAAIVRCREPDMDITKFMHLSSGDSRMPLSKNAAKGSWGEVLTWGVIKPDPWFYKADRLFTEITEEGVGIVENWTEVSWGVHRTCIDFDINMEGSQKFSADAVGGLKHADKGRLFLYIWENTWAGPVAPNPNYDQIAVQAIYHFSEEPPKRLWTPQTVDADADYGLRRDRGESSGKRMKL